MDNRKKRILRSALPALVLTTGAADLFAGGIGQTAAGVTYKVFDDPLIYGISYFIRTISTFAYVAGYLATALGLIGVLWNAFRLIFGTQQVRKACVDIGMKFLLFTVLINVYGSIISGVMNLATKLGMYAGNGYYETQVALQNTYENLKAQTKEAEDAINTLMTTIGEGGKISERAVKALAKNTGNTTEEVRKKFESSNIDVNGNVSTIIEVSAAGGGVVGAGGGTAVGALIGTAICPGVGTVLGAVIGGLSAGIAGYFGVGKAADAITTATGEAELYKKAQEAQEKELIKRLNDGDYADQFAMLKALSEVITPATNEDGSISYFFNPVMTVTGVGGDSISLLSPGSIIKMGVLWANLFKTKNETEYDSKSQTFLGRALDGTFQSITLWLMNIIMTMGIIFAMIFATIQYVMTIFEYFIVSSMGVLFIPCVLFDGTKSYAAKLVTLFVSFFVKITVTIMCLFFAVNMFAQCASVIWSSGKPCSLANFAYLAFTIILGFVLTQNAPQVAMTFLNGTPQLSMGEFLHAAGTVAAGAALAKRAAGTATKTAAPAVQGMNSGIADGFAAARGTYQGMREGGEKAAPAFWAAAKQGTKTAGNAWGSGILNREVRLMTGRDSAALANAGSLRSGVGSVKTIKDNKNISGSGAVNEETAGRDGSVNSNTIREIYAERARQAAAARTRHDGDGNGGEAGGGAKPVDESGAKKSDLREE